MILGDIFADFVARLTDGGTEREAGGHLIPYYGYGNSEEVIARGRLMHRYNVLPSEETESAWDNFLNFVRRFNTEEWRHHPVHLNFYGTHYEAQSDNDGYVNARFALEHELDEFQAWHPMTWHFEAPDGTQRTTDSAILVPPDRAEFGVISDLDDTVIRTDVVKRLQMVVNTVFEDSRTRFPLPGVAAFYSALQNGTGQAFNPIFYVSNSSWNLHDLMADFMMHQEIPRGPIFLRDIGFGRDRFIVDNQHKLNTIRHLLAFYPELNFILIGDSGEHDADYYAEITRENPDRILAVYIRDVDPLVGGSERDRRVQELFKAASDTNTDMLLIENTNAAAEHANEQGWITDEALAEIAIAVTLDEEEAGLI